MNNPLKSQITIANTNGNWLAYQPNNTPNAGWQTSYSNTNWANSGSGTQNNWQECLHNQTFGLAKPACNGNNGTTINYIWGPAGRATSYLKYYYNASSNLCDRHFITFAADNQVILWVNGTQIANLNNWQQSQQIEITNLLRCDSPNIISAQVIDVNGPYFFIANITRQTRNLSSFDVTSSEIDCKDPSKRFNLSATNYEGATYKWSGPNNFSSTSSDVTLDASLVSNPKLLQGWYKCTVTLSPCCIFIDSVEVRVPLNCCEVELGVKKLSCYDYQFTIKDNFVNISCFYWIIDGQIIEDPSKVKTITFGEGNHEICVHYLGRSKQYPDEICCNKVCTTINIPVVIRETQTRSYCDFDTYTGLEPSKEFDNSLYDYYILRQLPSNTGYDSRVNGQTWHAINQGTWVVDYYDNNGCLRKQLTVNVIVTTSTTTYCNAVYQNPCNDMIDPQTIMPNFEFAGCFECTEVAAKDPNAPFNHIMSKVNSNGQYISDVFEKRFYDYENCKICVFTYEIKLSVCQIDVDFDILPVPGQFKFKFVNRSTGNGQLIGNTWKVDGFFNQTYLPGAPETQELEYTFNGPGIYTICLTLCNFICEQECCANKCYTIRIDEEGRMFIIDENPPLPPPVQENADSKSEESTIMSEQNKIIIYPNPTSSKFKIQNSSNTNLIYQLVEIMDYSGKVINTFNDMNSDYEYNLSEYSKGIYLIRVKVGNEYQQMKLILQ